MLCPTAQRRHRPSAATLTALVVALLLVPGRALGDARLTSRIEALIAGRADLAGATMGIHVREVRSGETLYDHRGAVPMIPASNMKLLTTGAAAAVLGEDMVFPTRLRVSDGMLVVEGSGDPGFGDPALLELNTPPTSVDGLLNQLADAVGTAGSRIESVVVDDRIFDRQMVHPSWPPDQLNRWYCAEVSGLNLNTNCLTFVFRASDPQVPPQYSVEPSVRPGSAWLNVLNRSRAVTTGRNTVWIARPQPDNRLQVLGDVRVGEPASVDVAVHDPQLFAGYVLAERLAERRLLVGEPGPQTVRMAAIGEALPAGRTVAEVRTALSDILRRANADSQNLYTEALIKRIGHEVTGEPGSWKNGAAVVRLLLSDRLGAEHAAATTIEDGSGMSRLNTVPAATMTAWLASLFRDDAVRNMMLESMPSVGEGTLRDRFADVKLTNDLRAKSGSINGVRCLSGYVISDVNPDRAIAFSILINDVAGPAQRPARALHEAIGTTIDKWLTESDAARGVRAPALGG